MSWKNLFKNPAGLSPAEREDSVWLWMKWLLAFGAVLFLFLATFAAVPLEPTQSLFLLQVSVRLQLGAMFVSLLRYSVGVGYALVLYQAFENSHLGNRTPEPRSLVLAAMILGAAFAFSGGGAS